MPEHAPDLLKTVCERGETRHDLRRRCVVDSKAHRGVPLRQLPESEVHFA